MTRRGIHTTEFLATLLFNIGTLIAAFADAVTPKWAAILSAASIVAFTLSRGFAKQGNDATRPPPPPPPAG